MNKPNLVQLRVDDDIVLSLSPNDAMQLSWRLCMIASGGDERQSFYGENSLLDIQVWAVE